MTDTKNPLFTLGRLFDMKTTKTQEQLLEYDPADLTTHGFVTGMTGSGKTGLCIGLMEEAALHGIPAIIVDPKGDLTNLLLHFPNLTQQDFEPWIDPDLGRRTGKSMQVLAAETARTWKEGLAGWGLGSADLQALASAADFAIYTPGSSSGIPVNILSSFQPPNLPWDENREDLREEIASTVTALLGLVGLNNIDPLRSREHILVSNILESAWSQKTNLELTDLVLQVQNPSFDRLGAFPLESFFPRKDRFELAMLLNNFLASPSFQTWLEGQSLDIPALLYTPEGRPRHSVFYLAHLDENERMFFVTLLYAAIETWMRAQRGTGGLRALVYFDEIFGYLPPVANPPSKTVILRMLKQARAFGVGLLLATQNPVDVDYKALSNTGSWFIGRLQTDQDKQRLLDGLQSATGNVDRSEFDRLISGLQKRVFIYHNVRQPKPQVFTTRWTLNFLAGPLTRTQIPELNRLVNATLITSAVSPSTVKVTTPEVTANPESAQSVTAPVAPPVTVSASKTSETTASRTPPPPGIPEFFLPNDLGVSEAASALNLQDQASPEGIIYRPALLCQAEVRFINTRYNLQYVKKATCVLESFSSGLVRWDDAGFRHLEPASLSQHPLPQARFATMPGWLGDAHRLDAMRKEFLEWVYRTGAIQLQTNDALKIYAGPDISTGEFREMCSEAARKAMEAEQKALSLKYEKKMDALEQKVKLQTMEVDEQQDQVSHRRLEEAGAAGELLLGMLAKRRRSLSTSLTKRRLTQQAKSNLEEEKQTLAALESQLNALEAEFKAALQEVQNRWSQTVNQVNKVPLAPQKKDIFLELFGLAWLPYYSLKINGQSQETPAFRR